MTSTANTKFSTLPDIDLTAIDVYETSSSPELKPKRGGGPDVKSSRRHRTSGGQGETSDSDDSDDDVSDQDGGATTSRRKTQQATQQGGEIDQEQVDAEEAMRRFQDSVGMDGGSAGKRKSKGRRGDYLESFVESPAQKLARLKREMSQLHDELQASSSGGSGSGGANGQQGGSMQQKQSHNEPSPDVLIEQLRLLRLDLGKLNGSNETDGQEQQRLSQARKLLDSLQNPQTAATTADPSASQSISTAAPPAQALAAYESRLAHLETLIGSNQSILEETQSLARPLLPTVSRLEQLATLLTQPRHIDAVSKRVKVLVSELDRVYDGRKRLASLPNDGRPADSESSQEQQTKQQAANVPLDPISLSKLDDLFHLSTRIQPLLPLAPQLLQRLRSLATLHASASQFASSLEQLQEEQQEMMTSQTQFQAALSQVEKSIQDNNERTRTNLDIVMNRLEDVEKRVRAL